MLFHLISLLYSFLGQLFLISHCYVCDINSLRVYSTILIPLGCTSTVYLILTNMNYNRCREGIGDPSQECSQLAVCIHTNRTHYRLGLHRYRKHMCTN